MLEDSVRKIKGEKKQQREEEVQVEIKINGYIPNDYISESNEKILMYKKIASISSEEEYSDLVDELIDRFGDIPKSMINIMDISYMKELASSLRIKRIREFRGFIDFEFASKGLEEKYKDKVHFFKGISNYFILIDTDMKDALTDGQGKLYNSEGEVVVNEENYKGSSGIILPIGIDDEKVSTIDKLGLKVMPRLTNANKGWNSKEYFDSAINDFEKIEIISS